MNEHRKMVRLSLWVFLIAIVGITETQLADAGEISVTLLGRSAPVSSGSEIQVTLNALNASTFAVDWTFPESLHARLRSAIRTSQVRLRLASNSARTAIAPHSFATAQYALRLPADFDGDTVLEVDEFPGSAAVLKIESGTSSEKNAPPANPVASGSSQDKTEPRWKTVEFDPVEYFKRHLFPHEPFYFVAGPDSPNAKLQFSFKYQLVDDQSGLAEHVGFFTNFFFGFTQTSLWDWNKPSAPFEDSSYKPELMFQFNRLAHGGEDDWFRLDLQTGVMHESNGRDGETSRSLNLACLRPKLVFGHDDDWQFTLASRIWFYVGDLSDNPDIARYRGHVDLRATLGTPWGVELAAFSQFGDDFDRANLQLDLTIPLSRIKWTGFTWYLQAQYFTGYGESLLHYNERSEAWRIGFAIYR